MPFCLFIQISDTSISAWKHYVNKTLFNLISIYRPVTSLADTDMVIKLTVTDINFMHARMDSCDNPIMERPD